jgi:hypothetical protein
MSALACVVGETCQAARGKLPRGDRVRSVNGHALGGELPGQGNGVLHGGDGGVAGG